MARTRFLQVSQLSLEFKIVWVAQHGDDGSRGNQFVQQPEQLGRQGSNDKDDARDVAAGSVEACDQARSDRIGSHDEYDWRRRGCGFDCVRHPTTRPNYRGHLPADEISRQSRQPIWLIVRPVILDGDVLAFDESSVVETLPERFKDVFEPGSRRGPEKSDHRHRLLRPRAQRPCGRRRTSEQRHELPPSHAEHGRSSLQDHRRLKPATAAVDRSMG